MVKKLFEGFVIVEGRRYDVRFSFDDARAVASIKRFGDTAGKRERAVMDSLNRLVIERVEEKKE